jgi:hypothetical protein
LVLNAINIVNHWDLGVLKQDSLSYTERQEKKIEKTSHGYNMLTVDQISVKDAEGEERCSGVTP